MRPACSVLFCEEETKENKKKMTIKTDSDEHALMTNVEALKNAISSAQPGSLAISGGGAFATINVSPFLWYVLFID